jgi:hypothetical protein
MRKHAHQADGLRYAEPCLGAFMQDLADELGIVFAH